MTIMGASIRITCRMTRLSGGPVVQVYSNHSTRLVRGRVNGVERHKTSPFTSRTVGPVACPCSNPHYRDVFVIGLRANCIDDWTCNERSSGIFVRVMQISRKVS